MRAPGSRTRVVAAIAAIFFATSCAPAPRRLLTQEEKIADLHWITSQFSQNYAPLEYKEARHGIRFDALKEKVFRDAAATRTNEEFYLLVHRFVSEFRDAHTASTLTAATLPARTTLAYLGFEGKREGSAVRVTKFLPTLNTQVFPVQAQDLIVALDGVPLVDAAKSELIPYRDLGNDEANLTYHLPKLFNRTSLAFPLPAPEKENATLTLVRGEQRLDVQVPWIVKDLYAFTAEQAQAAAQKAKPSDKPKPEAPGAERIAGMSEEEFFRRGFEGAIGLIDLTPGIVRLVLNTLPGKRFWNSFVFIDSAPSWLSRIVTGTLASASGLAATPLEELKENRVVPPGALFVPAAKNYPTYISHEKTAQGMRYIATMYLNTFTPADPEEQVLTEVKETLRALKQFGVTDLVIDLIDNGGGSLRLGLQIAQLLSQERITLPELQLKINETWLDEFETVSLNAALSDPEREVGRRVFRRLKADLDAGRRLSAPFSIHELYPFAVQPDPSIGASFRVVLLVNEMCASMCDIFAAVLQDNQKAKVVGARTMGAGGNVVVHSQAPNSNLVLNQTESLILRRDGSAIENNGVVPDTALPVNETVSKKYEPVRAKAIELF
ncbi:MAG: S41 family peptidase [Oligoflexia bacterium]|nr:S41 family peptidase [Oligoflexia bacterium]